MLILKSTEFNIDLNSEDYNGWTAFDWVCNNGNLNIAELFIQESSKYNINLYNKDKNGAYLRCTDILNRFKDKGINLNPAMRQFLSYSLRKRPFIVIPDDLSEYEGFPVRKEFESTILFEMAVLKFWRRRGKNRKRAKMAAEIMNDIF